MENLIDLKQVSLAYGLAPLLDKVNLQIASDERVCLIGRNGAGKSSLLKIVEGHILPDSGSIWRKPQLRIARLEQELPDSTEMTVYDYVASGLAETGALLAEYHKLIQNLDDDHKMKRLEQLQTKIDATNGWQLENQVTTVLTRLDLPADQMLSTLSGGWQRRAALAKALAIEPELLLLDEPTNHLDIEAIEWLEDKLLNTNVGILFITHDRQLLQRLATRIIELDRGNLTSWPGDYENFLRRKAEMLHAEAKANADFDKKLSQEEVWIRQGIKARRTRNEGRVRALEAMRSERAARRDIQGKASFGVNAGDKSGQLVVEALHLAFPESKAIINDFSIRIMRGDRIGLVGPNGVGKSTLLNLLLEKLTPASGSVQLGTRLQVAYFDQLRRKLDPEKSLMDNVLEGSEFIEINGRRQHIISYLGDFLFTPARTMTPVKALSGGECNRLLLAKLFSQPANLLVMDEPTNDLDIETLELLEELLSTYTGTLLLVSHDRAFLDNVVTHLLVFTGNGEIEIHVGGYQDWLARKKVAEAISVDKPKEIEKPKSKSSGNKLSYKEQTELKQLPATIEKLESELTNLQHQSTQPEFYKQEAAMIATALEKLQSLEAALQESYVRWEELEERQKSLKG